MKKFWGMFLTIALVITLCAGCQGKDSGESSESESQTKEIGEAKEAEEEATGVEVKNEGD